LELYSPSQGKKKKRKKVREGARSLTEDGLMVPFLLHAKGKKRGEGAPGFLSSREGGRKKGKGRARRAGT